MEIDRKTKPSIEDVRRIIEKDGAKGWNLAKEALLKQETDNPRLKEALAYLTLIPDYFRPAIVAYCCEAVGGDPEITVPTGASLVLLAKAIGIHDDIIDNVKRRGKHITAYGRFGKEVALILSDILLFKGFTLMRKSLEIGVPPETLGKILETIDRVWFEQSESEILEHQFRRKTDVLPEDCITKLRKRASEMEAITRIGAILGKASEKEVEALAVYGRSIGLASILREELIDMLELDVLKHRLKNESWPLPLIYALQKTEARQRLIPPILQEKRQTKSKLIEIFKTVNEFGGIDFTIELLDKVVDRACSSINMSIGKNKELSLIAEAFRLSPQELNYV